MQGDDCFFFIFVYIFIFFIFHFLFLRLKDYWRWLELEVWGIFGGGIFWLDYEASQRSIFKAFSFFLKWLLKKRKRPALSGREKRNLSVGYGEIWQRENFAVSLRRAMYIYIWQTSYLICNLPPLRMWNFSNNSWGGVRGKETKQTIG